MCPSGVAFCLQPKCWCADCVMSALLCTPICVSFLTVGGIQPSLPSPSAALLISGNWKLFLPRVEWNIHRTYSQVDKFISEVEHGRKPAMRFFFSKRKEERPFSPIPHSEPLPVYVYVCWRPLLANLTSWAALRDRREGSLTNVSLFAF